MIESKPVLCIECGSTKLSILASDRAGVPDRRFFNKIRPFLSKSVYSERVPITVLKDIVNRLILDNDIYKEALRHWLFA